MKTKIFAALAATLLLASCSDADYDIFESPAKDAGQGTLVANGSSISSLSFSWEAVEGVYQYGYTLTNPHGTVVRKGVTPDTEITFINLENNTAYTLVIDAFGANSVPTLRYTLQAVTDPIIQLAAPDMAHAEYTFDNGQITLSWPAVTDADTYDYRLLGQDGAEVADGTVDEPKVVFKTLPIGEYALYVTADSDDPARSRSDEASFSFSRSRVETGVYEGTYKSHKIGSYKATIHVFDDGTYVLDAFYGVEGYNLEFSVGTQNVITVLNAFEEQGNYRKVYTGRDDFPYVRIYQSYKYSNMSVSGKKHTVKLTLYPGDSTSYGADTFVYNE